jgi:hypothetical protein
MPTITKDQAVQQLANAVENAHPDDLAEIYNELFPEQPITESEVAADATRIIQRVKNHITRGLEIEEILDLWNVVFPEHRDMWFDEEKNAFHYEEDRQPVPPLD